MKTVLITGGTGFVGRHLVEYIIDNTDWNVVVLKRPQGSSIVDDRVEIIEHNLNTPIPTYILNNIKHVDYIIHLAALSDVSYSIKHPVEVIQNNNNCILFLLECARSIVDLEKMIILSTEAVYGPSDKNGGHTEKSPYFCTSPYAASKAFSEQISIAYLNSYFVPVINVNSMNIIGERQSKNKFLPICIKNVSEGIETRIHKGGSRYYVHVKNICNALLFLLENGCVGEKYNLPGQKKMSNTDLLNKVSDILGKEAIFTEVKLEVGRDIEYCLNCQKIEAMGYSYPEDFEELFKKTVLASE